MRRSPLVRYPLAAVTLLAGGLSLAWPAEAEAPTAPATVQSRILTVVVPYNRNYRSKGKATVVLVYKDGSADSESAALNVRRELGNIGKIGEDPLETDLRVFQDASSTAAACRNVGAVALYVAPDLDDSVSAIHQALSGSGIVTFAAVEHNVKEGLVVGVAVRGGKPKMSINLSSARSHRIDFPASVLKLARVYQ